MKKFELNIANDTFDKLDLSNLFHVYEKQNEGLYFNLNRTINIIKSEDIAETNFTYYQINQGDTWTLISYKNYGTIKLWWLICKTNGINNPVATDPEQGNTLKILNKDVVNQILDLVKNS